MLILIMGMLKNYPSSREKSEKMKIRNLVQLTGHCFLHRKLKSSQVNYQNIYSYKNATQSRYPIYIPQYLFDQGVGSSISRSQGFFTHILLLLAHGSTIDPSFHALSARLFSDRRSNSFSHLARSRARSRFHIFLVPRTRANFFISIATFPCALAYFSAERAPRHQRDCLPRPIYETKTTPAHLYNLGKELRKNGIERGQARSVAFFSRAHRV